MTPNAGFTNGWTEELNRLRAENARLEMVRCGALMLCQVYFQIAADAIGEDEVRARREAVWKNIGGAE